MANAAFLASLAWQIAYSLAAPTPNTTTTNLIADPGWKKEPKGRGTFSIILSSVLTLGLCVWTAIHPNVKQNASTWQKVKHKLFFVVIGMLAPEVVLAVAFYQWREARTFHREWCDLYHVAPGSDGDTLRMQGAFFVTMGGVSLAPGYKVPENFRNILSAWAYLALARTEPEVVEPARTQPDGIIKKGFVHFREVQDKGKAEILGKTLVCVQALWMLVQCVVRKASGLPVTLLEIHVAMHVVCAIGMYGFWFNKPQDVGEPLPLPISDPGQVCIELVRQQGDCYGYNALVVAIQAPLKLTGTLVPPSPPTESVRFLGPGTGAPAATDPARLVIPYGHVLDLGDIRIGYDPSEELPIFKASRRMVEKGIVMGSEDFDIYTKAAEALKAGKKHQLPSLTLLPHVSITETRDILDDIYVTNVFPGVFILLAYGACHAAAWNTHFPSPVECLLWRISSVVVAIIPAYALFLRALHNGHHDILFSVCIFFSMRIGDFLSNIKVPLIKGATLANIYAYTVLYPVLAVICLAVLLGRLYLFVESFLSLRSLPWGSFDSTPWEDYWPHF